MVEKVAVTNKPGVLQIANSIFFSKKEFSPLKMNTWACAVKLFTLMFSSEAFKHFLLINFSNLL
jgi:hypothetical protein